VVALGVTMDPMEWLFCPIHGLLPNLWRAGLAGPITQLVVAWWGRWSGYIRRIYVD
jgi:hypothetical protein